MKNIAIVLAAGNGSRMRTDIPKQYMDLGGKPILYYSLSQLENSFMDEIILVVRAEDEEYARVNIVEQYAFTKVTHIVSGGAFRSTSVFCGLQAISDQEAYVYIHDGARPFITNTLLERLKADVERYGACVASVPVKDTIKVVDMEGMIKETPRREQMRIVQTPQAFLYSEIFRCYGQIQNLDPAFFTDDSMVMEHVNMRKVYLSEGDYSNIKITTNEDMALGIILLEAKQKK